MDVGRRHTILGSEMKRQLIIHGNSSGQSISVICTRYFPKLHLPEGNVDLWASVYMGMI